MSVRFRIERLMSTHNVGAFDCEDRELNDFLRKKALKEQSQGYSITYAMVNKENEDIIAYVAASASCVDFGKLRKRLFPDLHYPKMPAVLLGRVGRDKKYRDGIYGQIMIKYCLGLANIVSDWVGCRVVCVESYPETVSIYEKHGFRRYGKGTSRGPIPMYHDLAKGRRVHLMPQNPKKSETNYNAG